MLIVLTDVHFIIIAYFGKPFRHETCLLTVVLTEETNHPSADGKETQRMQPFKPKAPELSEWLPPGTRSRQILYTHYECDTLGFLLQILFLFPGRRHFSFGGNPQNIVPKVSFHKV